MHFSNQNLNKKLVSWVKSSKSNGFVLGLFCILDLCQNLTLENYQLCWLVVFFEQANTFEPKLILFPKIWIIIKIVENKRKFSDTPGHNILGVFNNLAHTWIPTSETIRDI